MRPWAPAGRAVPVLQASLCVSGPGTSGTPPQRFSGFSPGLFSKRPILCALPVTPSPPHCRARRPARGGSGRYFAPFPCPGGRPSPPQRFSGFSPGLFSKRPSAPPQQGPASATFRRVRRHHGQGRGACFQAAGVLGRKGLACQARKSPQGVVSLRAVWFADQYIFSYFFTISPRRIPSARLADSQTLATEVGLLMKCRMTYMSPPFVAAT